MLTSFVCVTFSISAVMIVLRSSHALLSVQAFLEKVSERIPDKLFRNSETLFSTVYLGDRQDCLPFKNVEFPILKALGSKACDGAACLPLVHCSHRQRRCRGICFEGRGGSDSAVQGILGVDPEA